MALSLKIGLDAIGAYKRLSYTPWHAIAEFVDNSTQSFFNNRKILESINNNPRPLIVTIDYSLKDKILTIKDNAMGMSYKELENALTIAKPPENSEGRSRYGMGLKTAACWIGNKWSIKTKKYGETTEFYVNIDVNRVISGENDLEHSQIDNLPIDTHYTIIEIRDHNRNFKGRTISKIRDYLSSMYRVDFRNEILTLKWNNEELYWTELDERMLHSKDGFIYKQTFSDSIEFENVNYPISGWIGVLESGSRKDAGFSIFHCGRVVKGTPDSWRPSSIFGQDQGSNDLVNQRLVGEINLDRFEISQAKDDILWLGDQEELVETKLAEISAQYRDTALAYRKANVDSRGPSNAETDSAIDSFNKEINSPEMIDIINSDPMLPKAMVESIVKSIKNATVSDEETFRAKIGELEIKGYVEEMSPNDPYLTTDSSRQSSVVIIINSSHPHWNQLKGTEGVLNFLRHCAYDGIAEWQAQHKVSRIDPDTIKLLKDKLLRLSLEIEKHENEILEDKYS